MSEQYQPPPGPPPNYRSQSQSDVNNPQDQSAQRQRERASWTVGGGPSSRSQGLGSNNPYHESDLNTPGNQQRPSNINAPSTSAGGSAFRSAPLPGPSSSKASSDVEMTDDEYMPPPGPPPGHTKIKQEFEPPPGPPPPRASIASPEPPPYDPWLGPDDNLRPPPSFSNVRPQNQKSPTANADYDDAARAHAWCRENPLWNPVDPDPYYVERIEAGDIRLTVPPNTTDVTQYQPAMGRSYIRTSTSLDDTILLSDIPIFASQKQSPLSTGHPQTLYFEVHVLGLGDRYGTASKEVECGIAIGFVAPPYPAWRLPGWHRGSLGVHSDDGRRYVDNSYGGRDFVQAFKKGDVVGIGMSYAPPVHGDRVSTRCQVFFTRNGTREGGWDLHEEQDMEADEGDIRGLEGEHDLLAAVGVFGSVELECVFRREEWMFKP